MAENTHINREKNDRLFKFIFGNAEHKHLTLELYNAINGTSFKNADNIEIDIIEDAVCMSMKNAPFFTIADTVKPHEDQNMLLQLIPVRMVYYLSMFYSQYLDRNGLWNKIYSSERVPLPAPNLVAFYVGDKKIPEKMTLKFSDLAPETSTCSIEAITEMVNISRGNNQDLLNRCRPLSDYALFTSEVRQYNKTMELEEAVNKALLALPDDSEVKKLILSNKAEVTNMFLFEYDEKGTMEAFREEGMKEKAISIAKAMLKKGIAPEIVAECTSLPIETITKLKK